MALAKGAYCKMVAQAQRKLSDRPQRNWLVNEETQRHLTAIVFPELAPSDRSSDAVVDAISKLIRSDLTMEQDKTWSKLAGQQDRG